MTTVNSNDVEAGVAQALQLVDAGAQLVRFTAQGVREAKAIGQVRNALRERGCQVPLSADIHFNPKAAYEAATQVEKVRINPGNFYDPARTFQQIEYTEAEYKEEVKQLQAQFADFLSHCKKHHTAIRIGVNHGSLSDRIMSHYGNTPAGMVESCMEFLKVCHRADFKNVVISMKSSNPLVMTEAVRLLVKRMEAEGLSYPLHLGVTEAGDGEDGRLKSAIGIGTLLAEGIGDTIRVSLSEKPEAELPECQLLIEATSELAQAPSIEVYTEGQSPYRSESLPLVIAETRADFTTLDSRTPLPDLFLSEVADSYPITALPTEPAGKDLTETLQQIASLPTEVTPILLLPLSPSLPLLLEAIDLVATRAYIIGVAITEETTPEELPTLLGFYLGGALLRGQGAGLYLQSPPKSTIPPAHLAQLAFGLLQASRRRISKTDYISCPGCGRTLFDLQQTVAKVKAATEHLKGLKIGVMGCIVNGPGEMADADYGYVGSAVGKIDLYKEKQCIRRGIPQDKAVEALIALIKEHDDWHDTPQR